LFYHIKFTINSGLGLIPFFHSGPSHKKSFTVCLKLGDTEEYLATGPSIKKAQHAAAAMAIEKTKLKHPAPKIKLNTKQGFLFSSSLLR
jgi:hypothetical protein